MMRIEGSVAQLRCSTCNSRICSPDTQSAQTFASEHGNHPGYSLVVVIESPRNFAGHQIQVEPLGKSG